MKRKMFAVLYAVLVLVLVAIFCGCTFETNINLPNNKEDAKAEEKDVGSSKSDSGLNKVADTGSGEPDTQEAEKVKDIIEKTEDAVEKKAEVADAIEKIEEVKSVEEASVAETNDATTIAEKSAEIFEEVTPEKIEDVKEIPEDSKTEFVAKEVATGFEEVAMVESAVEVVAVEEIVAAEEAANIEVVTIEEITALIDVLECATEIAEAREEDKFTQEDVKECEETGLADVIDEEGSGATVDVGPIEVGTNIETVADVGFDMAIEDFAVEIEDAVTVDFAVADATIADTYDAYETCNAGDTYDANEIYDVNETHDAYDANEQDYFEPDVCGFDFAIAEETEEEVAEEKEEEVEAIEEVAVEIMPEEEAQDDALEIADSQEIPDASDDAQVFADTIVPEEIAESQEETSDSDWILYENPDKGFRFYYPACWTLIFDDGMKVTFDSDPDSVDDQENRIYAEVAILLNESGGSDIEFIDNLKARLVDKLDVDGTQVKIGINGTGEHLALFAVIPLNHAVVAINVWHMYPEWESISDTKNTFAKLVLSFDNM